LEVEPPPCPCSETVAGAETVFVDGGGVVGARFVLMTTFGSPSTSISRSP
jgi:hypothetical protein